VEKIKILDILSDNTDLNELALGLRSSQRWVSSAVVGSKLWIGQGRACRHVGRALDQIVSFLRE
jgi:hypothetical protein